VSLSIAEPGEIGTSLAWQDAGRLESRLVAGGRIVGSPRMDTSPAAEATGEVEDGGGGPFEGWGS